VDGRLRTRKSGSASTNSASSLSPAVTSDWSASWLRDGSGADCASCAAAADVNTVSNAAAEKTIERCVMTNMSCCSPLIGVYVRGVTINEAFMRP
jgi:hypothetical protein